MRVPWLERSGLLYLSNDDDVTGREAVVTMIGQVRVEPSAVDFVKVFDGDGNVEPCILVGEGCVTFEGRREGYVEDLLDGEFELFESRTTRRDTKDKEKKKDGRFHTEKTWSFGSKIRCRQEAPPKIRTKTKK